MSKLRLPFSDASPETAERERERIVSIAANQRMIILVMLAYLGTSALFSATSEPGVHAASLRAVLGLAALCVIVAGIVFVARLAKALDASGSTLIWVILLLIPLVGLLVLAMLNRQATRELRQAGLKVGFFGVSSRELVQGAAVAAAPAGASRHSSRKSC